MFIILWPFHESQLNFQYDLIKSRSFLSPGVLGKTEVYAHFNEIYGFASSYERFKDIVQKIIVQRGCLFIIWTIIWLKMYIEYD